MDGNAVRRCQRQQRTHKAGNNKSAHIWLHTILRSAQADWQLPLGLTPDCRSRGGTIALRQDGSFTYGTPPAYDDGYGGGRPFLGTDSFRYVIRSEAATLTARVNIDVEIRSSDADYVVTTPGHYYAISGLPGENPVLQLTPGRTYRFRISVASVHPFAILEAPPGSVTNNNITEGTLTFAVPQGAQSYRYRCTTHEFGNVIQAAP